MAVTVFAQAIGTTPVEVPMPEEGDTYMVNVWVHNHEHGASKSIYIGPANVTASTGMHVPATETVGPIPIPAGETIHLISDQAGGVACRVLMIGA